MKPSKILSMSFVTGLSGALMPGPVLAVTISSVIQMGFIAVIHQFLVRKLHQDKITKAKLLLLY